MTGLEVGEEFPAGPSWRFAMTCFTSKAAAPRRVPSDRASLYQEITSKIIAELEARRVPWVQPWGTAAAKAPLAMPKNAATSRGYSGINVPILWAPSSSTAFRARVG